MHNLKLVDEPLIERTEVEKRQAEREAHRRRDAS
jgi:hypothetical protein